MMLTFYLSDKCKSIFITILLLFLSNIFFSQLNVTVDHADSYYNSGETVIFNITSDSSGIINYTLKYDDYASPISIGTIDIFAGETVPVSYSTNESGIILCEIIQGENKSIAGAAFSPFDIEAFADEPVDFDTFWNTQIDNLTNIPIDPEITFYANNDYATTYRINLANIDNRRIYGYLSIPDGTGPFPAMISFPSFGDIANITLPEPELAEKGNMISLTISIHNDEPDEIDPMAYLPNDITTPDGFYYKQAVMAGVRCIDYIFSRPDFDGENIIITGVSQGAGLSTLVAGIDNRVKYLITSNPILGQNLGLQNDRAGGFPNYINQSIQGVGTPAHEVLVAAAAKYYDAIYFARRFQGISWTFISYKDLVTPAATSFAVFNALSGQKHLTHSLDLGHSHPFDYWNGRFDFMRRFVPGVLDAPFPFPVFTKGYMIDAGENFSIEVTESADLSGTMEYNSTINPTADLVWKKINGPGNVVFSNENNYNTSAIFSEAGIYTLQFSATDYSNNLAEDKYYTLIDEIIITVTNSSTQQSQIINFNPISNQLNTNPPFSINATASSSLPVNFEIVSGPATLNGNIITLDGTAGTVTIKASQSGDNLFLPAPDVLQNFEVEELALQTQSISFDPIPNKLSTDAPFQINASASSGLPISFQIIAGPAIINGNTIALNGISGTVLVQASQSGNSFFLPAQNVIQTFEVEELINLQSQQITFAPIADQLITNNPFQINATSTSGLPIIFEVISGPITMANNWVSLNGTAGTVIIQASQDGNTFFAPAANVTQSFEINNPQVPLCENSINLALKRPTKQSGTQLGATSYRAVDGNLNGDFFAENSVTNTDWKENAFWEVDLGSISNIETINIWNRTDCCNENLKEFYVLVSDEPFVSEKLSTVLLQNFISPYFIEDIAGSPSQINIDRTGRYIRLQLKNEGAITMTELEVIGCSDNPNPILKPNLNDLFFYPNPADSFITITSESFIGKKLDVLIYTSDGILALKKTVNEVAEKTFEISTVQLESGAYFIKIDSEKFNGKTFPFIVIH
ncbi:MAG: acetylxylan esterase [Saprospiraceae bacterium]